MTPEKYCQEKAARSGSSFYYSFLFLPEPKRLAITALYAFCREVDDVVDECQQPALAKIKLQWWREEIAATFSGNPSHPVCKALVKAIETYCLPQEYFQEIIDGMQMDLDYQAYPSFAELSLYCYRAASVVGLMAAHIFGYKDRTTLRYAHDLGMAMQLTNILRDVREDALRGRIYIPLDELGQHGLNTEDLLQTKTTDNLRALFSAQANRARYYYQRALAQLPHEDRYAQRSGLIMAAIYQSLLREIEQDGYRVLEQRIKLTPLRKLWIAWRTARQESLLYRQFMRTKANT